MSIKYLLTCILFRPQLFQDTGPEVTIFPYTQKNLCLVQSDWKSRNKDIVYPKSSPLKLCLLLQLARLMLRIDRRQL